MDILSEFVFPAPPSTFVKVMTVVSTAALVIIGFSETKGKHLQYSKFWNANNPPNSSSEQLKVPGRLGMLLIYSPAFLAGVASFWFFPNEDRRILMFKSAVTFHFFKRNFEVLFVHKYSSKMALDSALLISLSYFSFAAISIYAQHLSQGLPEPAVDLKNFGMALFAIGIIGNFYHHYLLSITRAKGETGYKIPKGGLFGVVICPHYLFEIIVFFGFALISQTLYSVCFSLGTAVYLGGRSYATRRWYVSKFEDFPQHVKALVPFVF